MPPSTVVLTLAFLAVAGGASAVGYWLAQRAGSRRGRAVERADALARIGQHTPYESETSFQEKLRLGEVVAATPDIVVMVDAQARLIYANAAARASFGFPPDGPLPDLSGPDLLVPRDRKRLIREAIPGADRDGVWSGELALALPAGGELAVSLMLLAHRREDGTVDHYSSISRDISDRQRMAARLEHVRRHDTLTGLPNRATFAHRLDLALLARSGEPDQPHQVAVLMIDLDHFKYVNDSYGHDLGDELLIRASERIAKVLGADDMLARFGGDEFGVLRPAVMSSQDAMALGTAILEALGAPFAIAEDDGQVASVHLTASIGAAISRDATSGGDELARDADAAMFKAKERGRNRLELFVEDLRHSAVHRLRTANDLHRALAEGEFRVLYQPEILLENGHLHAVEALVRWNHPSRGLVPPIEFIPLAEETGLITAIGLWVLETAARQAVAWRGARWDGEPIVVWVNLSARQLASPALVDDVARVLDAAGVPSGSLGLEITESALLDDTDAAVATLERLRALGVPLSVDDFGTGYSSLTYLKRLPVDQLKVDRSFVGSVGDADSDDAAIVRAIIAMAAALKLRTVAEGVELAEQLEALRTVGCDYGQGFYFATPQPASHIQQLLDADRAAALFPPPAALLPPPSLRIVSDDSA